MLTSARRSISYPNTDFTDRPNIPAHMLNLVDALEVDMVYVKGLRAARLGSSHMEGVFFFETDTGLSYFDDGANWNLIGVPVTLRGRVGSTGTIDAGTGFTVTKGATGVYTINFTVAFSVTPVFLLTPVNTTTTSQYTGHITSISSSSAVLMFRQNTTANGVAIDTAFHFQATDL